MTIRSLIRPIARPVLRRLGLRRESHPVAAPGFRFRAGTWDRNIFHTVSTHNEYRLPPTFDGNDVIIDVGAHIGSFCYAVLARGAGRVYGFEAEADNYRCAVANLSSFTDRVRLHNRAVWRSDRPVDHLFFQNAPGPNTGGGNVGWAESGRAVPAVALDDVIREATGGEQRRVRLLKLDCEGAEFAILLTSRMLHQVDQIVGEFHEFGGDFDPHDVPNPARVDGYDRFTIVELTAALEAAGFVVTSERTPGSNIGLFFATAAHSGTSRAGWAGRLLGLPARLFR